MIAFERWPFEAHAWALEPRWWEACYAPLLALPDPDEHASWLLIYGGALTGKSVALAAIERGMSSDLTCQYPLELWPKDDTQNHLNCLMTAASHAVMDFLRDHPQRLGELTGSQFEFLHWLISRFNKPRTLGPFLDSLVLDRETDQALRGLPEQELYNSPTDDNEVRLEINELVSLCRRWGYRGITFFTDIPFRLFVEQTRQIKQLYAWLSLMQNAGFRLIATAPQALVQELGLHSISRGRVKFTPLENTPDEAWLAADRHVQFATRGQIAGMQALAQPELLAALEQVVQREFDTLPVGAWVAMGCALLESNEQPGAPPGMEAFNQICISFFRNSCPLWLEPTAKRKGIWRGQRFIALEQAQYEVAERMWFEKQTRDHAVDFQALQITKEMMHSRIKRLREAIEPLYIKEKQSKAETQRSSKVRDIYIDSTRDEGYRFL